MEEKLRNKKVIVVSSTLLIMTIIVLLVITLKDSYAYYGNSNELEIMKATIGKLKPTIEKVFIEEENKQYSNNPNPSVTITWTDDNITEYCVTTESTCTDFKPIDSNSKSVTDKITLTGEKEHAVKAYIKNKYGYTSEVKSDTITLDTTPPTISSLSTTEINETTITVSVIGSDANGIKQYCYGTSQNDYTCTDSSNHTFSNLSAGKEYTFWFYLVDNAGNDNKVSATQQKFTTESKSAKDIIIATSKSLESEEEMQARNDKITTDTKDDLRRFVGDKTKVNDNFICFGTSDQQACKDNMDTYMYRIIGIDTQNRLKVIKATELVNSVAYGLEFAWNSVYTEDIKWNDSDLYKGLNGGSPHPLNGNLCNQCFVGNSKYGYMNESTWTKLIDITVTYYIGDSTAKVNPTLFVNERKSKFDNGRISLMYLSDYLYADNGTASKANWLFIQNGLNGANNTPSDATKPSAKKEWMMTRHGKYAGFHGARGVDSDGTVYSDQVNNRHAVRPVFYLIPTTRIFDGNGTIDTPYIIAP